MSYHSGDDPRLLHDLRTALRRWRTSTVADLPLAARLAAVGRRRAANPRLTQAAAMRETVLAGLAQMHDSGWASQAALLQRRYVEGRSVYHLQQVHNLSERTIYYRLREALRSLAQTLWATEQDEAALEPPLFTPKASQAAQWRARHLPPPTYAALFGVEDVLAHLLRCLNLRDGHWMISVDGMGGLGKTALVRTAAARVAGTDRFADIAWLTIGPECYLFEGSELYDQHELTCDQVLDGIGHQLSGVDLRSLPQARKREAVRALLRARPYLVVVDNLEMIVDYERVLDSLRELANPSKFLFTSRCRMDLEAYSWTIVPLAQMAEAHCLALVRYEGRLRGLTEVAEASDDALRQIYAVTGGNPLAIKLVVGQLLSLPLNRALAALKNVQPSTETFYDYLYSASWSLLSIRARDLLTRLARLPATGGTWQELSTITGLSDQVLASTVAELTAHSLLESAGLEEKTYTIHPLTHHFVIRQAAR